LTRGAPVAEPSSVITRPTLLLASLLALHGTTAPTRAEENPLLPFRQLTLPGGIASAATCVSFADPADGGPTGGTLNLDGLPPGAEVQEAWLYWTVLSDASPVPSGIPLLDGAPLVVVPIGELAESPCFPQTNTAAFRADVTGLVTGNGSYVLSGLLGDGMVGGNADLTEGATLMVLYCAPGEPDRSIVWLEGLDVQINVLDPFTQDIAGFVARADEPVPATLIVAAGNGQARNSPEEPGMDTFIFNEVDLDPALPEILSGGLCPPNGLYDHTRLDVTGLVPADSEMARLVVQPQGDCYTVAAVALVVDTIPGLGLPEPSALDRNPAAMPLTVARTPSGLELRWEDLGAGAIYHAYRGTLGSWYDHGETGACELATPDAFLPQQPGSSYFLAVTEGCGGAESTPGRDSLGAGRPSAADASGRPCP